MGIIFYLVGVVVVGVVIIATVVVITFKPAFKIASNVIHTFTVFMTENYSFLNVMFINFLEHLSL